MSSVCPLSVPGARVDVILQSRLCVSWKTRKQLPHNVVVLYLLVRLKLVESSVEVIEESL